MYIISVVGTQNSSIRVCNLFSFCPSCIPEGYPMAFDMLSRVTGGDAGVKKPRQGGISHLHGAQTVSEEREGDSMDGDSREGTEGLGQWSG